MLPKKFHKKVVITKYGLFFILCIFTLSLTAAIVREKQRHLINAEQPASPQARTVVPKKPTLFREKSLQTTFVGFPLCGINKQDDQNSFYKHVANTLKYPYKAIVNQIQGDIVVNFDVTNNQINNIDIDPKLGYGIEEDVVLTFGKYKAKGLANGSYSIKIAYRMRSSARALLNQSASLKEGYTALRPIELRTGELVIDPNNRVHNIAVVDIPPSYPGGLVKFYAFLKENIQYPEDAKKEGIEGKVYVSFVVEKNGKLTDIKIDRKLGYGTDEEAIRVLKLSAKWIPGIKNGMIVRTQYNMPIKFPPQELN